MDESPTQVIVTFRVATYQKLKNSWHFTDFWTIFTDLKLATSRWYNDKKQWKPLIKTTISANVTQIDGL